MSAARQARPSSRAKRRALAKGPIGWKNWRAFELGTRRSGQAFEIALYSDSRFVDELRDLGPYMVFNTVADVVPSAGAMSLGLVLRVEQYGRSYVSPMPPPMDHPTVGSHHGGWMADEIAALLSLSLGIRCHAGEVVRRFEGPADRGVPTQWSAQAAWPSAATARPVLPNVARSVNLDDGRALLKLYPSLSAAAATSLVRAARQFQRALLLTEIDPNTGWLQLVSAVEVAAQFRVEEVGSPWDTVATGSPEIADELRRLTLARRTALAELLAPQMRAAAKYRRFLKDFPAPPPGERPLPYAQLTWSKRSLSEALVKVYEHRSQALHGGIPFPSPMCSPPMTDDDGVPAEAEFSSGVGRGDAYWPREELPMEMHVYVHIVGHALRTWWRSLADQVGDNAPPA